MRSGSFVRFWRKRASPRCSLRLLSHGQRSPVDHAAGADDAPDRARVGDVVERILPKYDEIRRQTFANRTPLFSSLTSRGALTVAVARASAGDNEHIGISGRLHECAKTAEPLRPRWIPAERREHLLATEPLSLGGRQRPWSIRGRESI